MLPKILKIKSPWSDGEEEQSDVFNKNRKNFGGMNFGGGFSVKFVLAIAAAFVLLWLGSGIYEVQEGEEAVVIRFGKFDRKAYPGLNYRLPNPIEYSILEPVNRSRRIEIGYRSSDTGQDGMREVLNESSMLTGDENIILVTCDVMWHIKDLASFLFRVANPVDTVKAVAQSAIREVIGQTPIAHALANQKKEIADKIEVLLQKTLESYDIGVEIEKVQLLRAEPPQNVISAYRDVQTARADKETKINQAQAYRNDVLPKARGKAAEMIQEAEGYKHEVVSRAKGDVERFVVLLNQYNKNQDTRKVMRDRLYLDAMKSVLAGANKTIVNQGGLLPHMAINSNNK